MKKFRQILVASILTLIVTACGIDYTITTRIYPDGSCERIMTARIDSSELSRNLFFIPIDSTWNQKINYEFDTSENKTYAIVTVKKNYTDIKEMNTEFYRKDDITKKPNLKISLTKKFRWFYTKYHYEETYIQQFPFRHFPLTDYLTENEIEVYIFEESTADSIFFAGKDSLERKQIEAELDTKAEKFISDNVFEEFYLELERVSRDSEIAFFRSINLRKEKETINTYLKPYLCVITDNCEDTSAYSLLLRLDEHYNTTAFSSLIENDTQAFETFNKKLNFDCFTSYLNYYHHNVILPGTLLNTNAQKIVNDEPRWEFDLMHYVFSDYTMWSESKKTNTWAYGVTILLILFSIATPVIRSKFK